MDLWCFIIQLCFTNKTTAASCFFRIFKGSIQRVLIRDLIKNRLIMANQQNGKRLYARFSQIVAHIWGFGYAWLDAQKFNIDEHLIEISNENRLNTDEDLQSLLVRLRNADLDYQKPLWLIYYKTNYGPDRQTLVIFMYHMSLSDGVSLMRIFFKSLVDDRMAIDVKNRFASRKLGLNLLKECFIAWKQILYRIVFRKTEDVMRCNTKLSGEMNVNWSEPFNFVDAHRVGLVTRSSLNDVLMSVLAGSIRTYMQTHHGIRNPSNLSCMISVNLRSNKYPVDLGYESTLVSIDLPVNVEGD
jgi:diacylglycerol O-acyltransferase